MNAPLPPARTYPPITTADIAAICAATGDASPLHLDEAFARASGHPSVVAPGTILMGWLGEYIEDTAGLAFADLKWSVRLVGPTWPGDCLTVETVSLEKGPSGAIAGAIEVRTHEGRVVGKARFEVRHD
jgi:acyl dehydratase